MKAILLTKDGFKKEVMVPDPPPATWEMIETEDTSHIDYREQADLRGLADVVYKRRFFQRKGIIDPEERIRALRMHNEIRGSHSESEHFFAEHLWKEHEKEYGTMEPVVIYEERDALSPAKKKELVQKAYEAAIERGLLYPDIPVESTDNKRFIELDT